MCNFLLEVAAFGLQFWPSFSGFVLRATHETSINHQQRKSLNLKGMKSKITNMFAHTLQRKYIDQLH